jgi:hypothetical protein
MLPRNGVMGNLADVARNRLFRNFRTPGIAAFRGYTSAGLLQE